ncbi:MAG: TatD family hydrolase [Defluviitaleaceae bacterium]|nr:TatD family hydrolase [Defluviitaleaceae bacterium]
MYFDSHAHYDDVQFDRDRDFLLRRLPSLGVDCVINAGSDIESSKKSIALADEYDYIYAAVGVHPHEAEGLTDGCISELEELAKNRKAVAIGETGLDYYYDHSPRSLQRKWFSAQLDLAVKLGLPVVVHMREAAADTMEIIKKSNARRGIIHCYSGSKEMALEYAEIGFYIGIGGSVTFDKAKKIIETADALPLEKILIETDAPYMSPVPKRGLRNDSTNLFHIVNKIAEIKKTTPESVASAASANARALFKII